MSFDHLWQVIRRFWLLILAFVVAGLGLSVVYLRLIPAEYTARADVYVSVAGVEEVGDLSAASAFAEQQARNFAVMANRQLVLDPVHDRLQLKQTSTDFARSISATVPSDTSIIVIEAKQPSAQDAATVVNAVAGSLADAAGDLLPPARRGAPAIKLEVVQEAEPPQRPSTPNVWIATSVGLVGGFLAGVATALLLDATRRSSGSFEPATRQMVGSP